MSHESSILRSILPNSECIEKPSAWIGHIPFAHWLGEAWKPDVFVELGTHWGHSFFNICAGLQAADVRCRSVAVDTWSGDEHSGSYGEEVYSYVKEIQSDNYSGMAELLRKNFQDALSDIEDGSVDLLHIDGCHTYESVKVDFEQWRPKLSDRALVLFHDTQVHEEGFEVWKFWEELTSTSDTWLEFTHSNGLGVYFLSESSPPDWLVKGSDEQNIVRDYFQAQGGKLVEECRLRNEVLFLRERLETDSGTLDQAEKRCCKAELHSLELKNQLQNCRGRLALAEKQHTSTKNSLHDMTRDFLKYRNGSWWMIFRMLSRVEEIVPLTARMLTLPPKLALWFVTGSLSDYRRAHQECGPCLESGYLDLVWYLQKNVDVRHSGVNPALHWCAQGWREGRNPGPDFDVSAYLRDHPEAKDKDCNPLLHYLAHRSDADGQPKERAAPPKVNDPDGAEKLEPPPEKDTVREVVCRELPTEIPLRFRAASDSGPRVTLVTDSVNSGSLFGGVSTAILFAAKLAESRGADLRIMTLNEPAQRNNPPMALKTHGVSFSGTIEYVFSDNGKNVIPEREGELFLTTSWWTTRRVRHTISPDRILYILQEDERMFYPYGDEWVRCAETLADPDIRTVVNSEYLYEHLCGSELPHLRETGTFFEPSFVPSIYHPPQEKGKKDLKRFFFYARPLHSRNLLLRGMEAVSAAVESGVLNFAEWEIVFAGSHVPELELPGGMEPVVADRLPWEEYAELVRNVDLGLSLMLTPHPSYPPLDLAACGAVVVTNRFGVKQNLNTYSENILCTDLDVSSLVDGIARGVKRLENPEEVRRTWEANGLKRDWNDSFDPVLQWLGDS